MQNRKVSSLVGINSGKCSKIFAESKFSALFFTCGGRFPFPEPLFELLTAAEEQTEEDPPQQRVVDVPPAYVGVAIQYVQERAAGQLSRRRLIMHSSGRSGRAWNLMRLMSISWKR